MSSNPARSNENLAGGRGGGGLYPTQFGDGILSRSKPTDLTLGGGGRRSMKASVIASWFPLSILKSSLLSTDYLGITLILIGLEYHLHVLSLSPSS